MAEHTFPYVFVVAWSEEDGEYVGHCNAFPSLSWLAPTHQEAFDGIHKLVHETVMELIGNGEPLTVASE